LKAILVLVIILSLTGVADSCYALNQHYAEPDLSSCDFNETVSCTAVNQSKYSEVAGVPVAGIGIAGYVLYGTLACLGLTERYGKTAPLLLLLTALGAAAVSLFLTYIEVFVLNAVCPLCVISLTLVLAVTGLSAAAVVLSRKSAESG
jgi:uncharacterized membrane protein